MALTPLLPVRHPQGDFFVADIFDNLPFKDDLASMEHPLFTLQTNKPDMRTLRYENGPASLEVSPNIEGLPTIMDKDILLYCASVMMHKINAGETPPKTIRFSMRDVLLTTNRMTNKNGYTGLKKALKRLAGALVKTTIKTGRTEQGAMFHMVEKVEYLESTRVKDRQIGVALTVSDWFYNSLIAAEVLTIDREYFQLRKPLERRLYELARKHCGYNTASWPIGLEKLLLKTGSKAPLAKFRFLIRQIEASNHLPEFSLSFDTKKDMVTVRYKKRNLLGKNAGAPPADPMIPRELGDLSPGLLEDCRKHVGKHYDFYGLWNDYKAWDGSQKARSVRGGFIGFCRKKVIDVEPKRAEEQPDLFDD